MAIVLEDIVISAKTIWSGFDTFDLATGKKLEIKKKTPTENILDVEVPSGKSWHVTVSIYIEEKDA